MKSASPQPPSWLFPSYTYHDKASCELSGRHIDWHFIPDIRLALERNYSIEENASDLESARWSLREARRNTGPTLSWTTEADVVGGKAYDGYGHDGEKTRAKI